MAQFEQKEKYSGVWNGSAVRFNRVFRGHRLTDKECERLCAGEEIEIRDLVGKSGKTYGVTGRLANLEYNGHPYVGVEQTGFAKRGIPAEFCKHVFSDSERDNLEAGLSIEISDFVSAKTGNTFKASARYDAEQDRIVLEFNNNK